MPVGAVQGACAFVLWGVFVPIEVEDWISAPGYAGNSGAC